MTQFGPAGDGSVDGNGRDVTALRLDGAVVSSQVSAAALTHTELQPMVETAIALWTDAVQGVGARIAEVESSVEGPESRNGEVNRGYGAASRSQVLLERLQSVTVSIADLSGSYLAITTPSGIVIDINAAGQGWFIDPTPLRNEEFSARGTSGELRHLGGASSRVDLLTVLAHELGHVLGLRHDSKTDVMHADLPAGVRRPVQPELIDAAFSPDWYDYLLQ